MTVISFLSDPPVVEKILRHLGARAEATAGRGPLGSVQAIAAGALIWVFGWHWADPVASALIGLLVIYSAWSLLRETVGVLMEGAPGHIVVEDRPSSETLSEIRSTLRRRFSIEHQTTQLEPAGFVERRPACN